MNEDNEIILPLDKRVLEAFLNFLSKENGVSSVNGYVSAIKWFYIKKEITMSNESVIALKKVLGGVKRKVADMKQSGSLEVFEGKRHLTFEQYVKIVTFSLTCCTDFPLLLFACIRYLMLEFNGQNKQCGIVKI